MDKLEKQSSENAVDAIVKESENNDAVQIAEENISLSLSTSTTAFAMPIGAHLHSFASAIAPLH